MNTPASMAAAATAAAAHARRWKVGMRWRDQEIHGVAVISHWHVVLYLDGLLVELDPDDNVVRTRQTDGAPARVRSIQASISAELDAGIKTDEEVDAALMASGLDPASVPRGAKRLDALPDHAQGDLFALIPEDPHDP